MSAHIEETVAETRPILPAGQMAGSLQGEYSVGFPFQHLAYTKSVGAPAWRSYLSASKFALNVFCCIAAMIALVFCTQYKDSFTTKTILMVVAGVAIVIGCYPLTRSLSEVIGSRIPNHTLPLLLPFLYSLPFLYYVLIYFSPIPIAIALYSRADAAERPSRWWIALAIFSSTLGITSAGLGLSVFNETIGNNIAYGLAIGTVFLLFGAAWIAAAWLHWKQRHWVAGALNVAAFAISLSVLAFLISR